MDQKGGRKPVFIKVAPDLPNEALDDVIEVVLDNELAGIIATNTTINADIKRKYGVDNEMGGISGNDADFRRMSTEKIAHIYHETNGQINIIGVGGVRDVRSALEKIQMGARVVQIVTGVRDPEHFGPHLPGKINRGLVSFMDRNGVKSINELVGSAHKVHSEPLPVGELLAELEAPLVSKLYQAEMDPKFRELIEQVLVISSTTTPKAADLYRKIAWLIISRGEPWPEIWGPYNPQEVIPLMKDIAATYSSLEADESRGLTELPKNPYGPNSGDEPII